MGLNSVMIASLLLAMVGGAQAAMPSVSFSVDSTGVYSVAVDGVAWYTSTSATTVCVAGKQVQLAFMGSVAASGTDPKLGAWSGTTASYEAEGAKMEYTFKHFFATPELAVGTATFPNGLNTANCGKNTDMSTNFPQFDTTAAKADTLHTLSWRGGVIETTAAALGLQKLGATGLDCGPVVSTEPRTGNTLVWSTLDWHKIVPQKTSGTTYSMGIAGAIPALPVGFNYSIMFSAAPGGATAGMYHWGDLIQGYHGTTRLPSVTLSDIGYYTDDGAYYYVWGGGGKFAPHDPELSSWIPMRPWPAEVGLILVKEALYKMGVPVAYMQLDDWWYQGAFYFGNVKSVRDWHASNSSGLFPNGLPSFSDKLGLPLQLYTPFWADDFQTKYRTSESKSFKGTKLVVPNDSYAFFSDFFDLGKSMTNGRFNTYEIDFLDSNFAGCDACMADVGASDRWYAGMANAALERNISIQYCLPSATDMLESLSYPAVIQARASGDYARPQGNTEPWGNVVTLGGASLLLGATKMAPSKDTLWTASPQPATSSDRTHSGYTTQPHVQLDSILATLSLGPVGISDGLNETDAALIGQSFRSESDSTLLRPSRPLSTVDAVFTNKSTSAVVSPELLTPTNASDVRATHAELSGGGPNSHYVLAWMTSEEVTLQQYDLYPAPSSGVSLAVRQHVAKPDGTFQSGCVDGQAALECITILAPGQKPVIPATGNTIANFSYWSVYEPASNGAYFVGELEKFVHVSPQRFDHVTVTGSGPSGLTVGVKGTAGEKISLVAVDPKGITHVTTVTIPAAGSVDVAL